MEGLSIGLRRNGNAYNVKLLVKSTRRKNRVVQINNFIGVIKFQSSIHDSNCDCNCSTIRNIYSCNFPCS